MKSAMIVTIMLIAIKSIASLDCNVAKYVIPTYVKE